MTPTEPIKRIGGSMKKELEVLDMIIDDCEKDVNDFEGKPFNGKTVAEMHGILEAKIQALAKVVKKIAEQL